MTFFDVVNPEALGQPRGWNNGMVAPAGGRIVFVAGQVAADGTGRVPPGVAFIDQFGEALRRSLLVVEEAGGGPEHVGRLTVYVSDMDAYRASLGELGAVYRTHMGRSYPAMALVEVSRLVEPHALVEIEATAVLPAPEG
jgi:enamine deaminase RidA (YjgF/YER057c/UK114 family)